jgi:hypothetical protein
MDSGLDASHRPGMTEEFVGHPVIARSEAAKQSILPWRGEVDCFASLAKMGWTAPDGIIVPDW